MIDLVEKLNYSNRRSINFSVINIHVKRSYKYLRSTLISNNRNFLEKRMEWEIITTHKTVHSHKSPA